QNTGGTSQRQVVVPLLDRSRLPDRSSGRGRLRWRYSVLFKYERLDGADDGLRALVIGVEELDNAHLLCWILLQVRMKALCATTVHTISWRDKPTIAIVIGRECLCVGREYQGQGLWRDEGSGI